MDFPQLINNQNSVGREWKANNWSGACDQLAKIPKPTLVITGADDNMYVPYVNSLKIIEKIPAARLVQIKCWSCSNGSISGRDW